MKSTNKKKRYKIIVSPLCTNLQVTNLRCEHASGSSEEPEPAPSVSGVSDNAAHPPSPMADNPSAPPPPTTSLPSVSHSSCLLT